MSRPRVGAFRGQLGEAYRAQGNVVAAEPILYRALEIAERVLGKDDDRTASAANNLAALYHYGRKDLARAESLYRRALAIYESRLPPEHVYTAQVRMNLGTLLCERGECVEGRAMFDAGLAQMEKVVGKDAPELTAARGRMAQVAKSAPSGK